jgi:hypothetical protein
MKTVNMHFLETSHLFYILRIIQSSLITNTITYFVYKHEQGWKREEQSGRERKITLGLGIF